MIDWTKPLVVAGTDRVATLLGRRGPTYEVLADWVGDGGERSLLLYDNDAVVTNAPPTPQIGPEHIEALAEAIEETAENYKRLLAFARPPRNSFMDHAETAARYRALAEAAEQRAARLAEIRAYLESL